MVTPPTFQDDQYLINMHGNPILSSRIVDVLSPPSGVSEIGGSFVVRAPKGVVHDPADLADLLSQKYTNLLTSYPGYQYLAYDDLLDASGINAAASVACLGERSNISILPGSPGEVWVPGSLITNAVTLDITPSTALIFWEVFEYLIDESSGRIVRSYREKDSDSTSTCSATFDGTNYASVYNGQAHYIDPLLRGNQFKLRITNGNLDETMHYIPLWVGSWAVLY